jgi:hypothetical protein
MHNLSQNTSSSSGVPTGGGGGWGFKLPPNSEVLTKLSRIPSSVENTSITTLDIPKVWQSRTGLQTARNPWLGGYRPQIPVLSVLCPQLNFSNPPPLPKQNSWARHWAVGRSRLKLYRRSIIRRKAEEYKRNNSFLLSILESWSRILEVISAH